MVQERQGRERYVERVLGERAVCDKFCEKQKVGEVGGTGPLEDRSVEEKHLGTPHNVGKKLHHGASKLRQNMRKPLLGSLRPFPYPLPGLWSPRTFSLATSLEC